jgi:hypothetical protein
MPDAEVIYDQDDPSLIRNTKYGDDYFQNETKESLIGMITRNLSELSIGTLKQILFLIVAALGALGKPFKEKVDGGRRSRRNRKQSKSRRNR